MELALLPKEFRSDSKPLHHHVSDVLATVQTTQEIPKEAILGPCLLQDTQLETIAFIALKCSERRNINYVIKVDATAAQNAGGFPWMRLVQGAAGKEEQNLEAFLRNRQLYYRPTRKIHRNEELLVWYDEELSRLLGFSEIEASRRPRSELDCPNCKQVFKCEHSYLAHARFLCLPENSAQPWRNISAPKMAKSRSVEQSTNFHSLARDLDLKMAACRDAPPGERRTDYDELGSGQGRKPVLLEKTNCLHEGPYSGTREEGPAQHLPRGPVSKFRPGKHLGKKGALGQKESAFTEVRQMKEKLKTERARALEQGHGGAPFGKGVAPCPSGSAFSFVWPTRAAAEPKSAFSKPARCPVDGRTGAASLHLSGSVEDPGELPLTSELLASDLNGSPLLRAGLVQCNPFPPYTSGVWLRQMGEHLQTAPTAASNPPSASLTLLPPTFASFGVAAQNWCAKCNLSFRMTSDLVFHMRSHHKKEGVSPELRGERRREEKLACPVCQEYFRERHHLSRHMTSHN